MANGTITIDTDEFVARLTRAKFTRAQAEAAAKAVEKDVHIDTTELVTKEYLDMKLANHESRQWTKILALHITTAGIIIAAFGFFGG